MCVCTEEKEKTRRTHTHIPLENAAHKRSSVDGKRISKGRKKKKSIRTTPLYYFIYDNMP